MEELNNNDKKIVELAYGITNDLNSSKRKKIDDLCREYLESIERVNKNNEKIKEIENKIFNTK